MILKFNELNSTTYLSAVDKAKSYNQMDRANKIMNYVFYKFRGEELNGSKIKSIIYGGVENKLVVITTETEHISYSINKDSLLENPTLINRKSANLLSKIICTANPKSKYKSVNNMKIKGY